MLYRSIRSIKRKVDALMRGKAFGKAPIVKEGDLTALYARLILLNKRLASSAQQQQKDKQLMRRFLEDVRVNDNVFVAFSAKANKQRRNVNILFITVGVIINRPPQLHALPARR